MEIKDMLSTGVMVIIGVIALKAFGGVKGLTSMIGGIGDLLGTGGDSSAAGIDLVTAGDVEQIEIIEGLGTAEIDLLAGAKEVSGTYDVLGMLGWAASFAIQMFFQMSK